MYFVQKTPLKEMGNGPNFDLYTTKIINNRGECVWRNMIGGRVVFEEKWEKNMGWMKYLRVNP